MDTTPHQPTFVADVQGIRERARRHMEAGAVTEDYPLDAKQVVDVLNEVLATELVCTMRYLSHVHQARGLRAEVAAVEFQEHADEELQHVNWVAERIDQLGGVPDFDPSTLTQRSHAEFVSTSDLRRMIEENLVAERIAIETYRMIAQWLGNGDPTTRRLIERILEQEEEHADDMATLLTSFVRES
jgi:bacterioferritin